MTATPTPWNWNTFDPASHGGGHVLDGDSYEHAMCCVNACEGINPEAVPEMLAVCGTAEALLAISQMPHRATDGLLASNEELRQSVLDLLRDVNAKTEPKKPNVMEGTKCTDVTTHASA